MEGLPVQAERETKDEVRLYFTALKAQLPYDLVLDLIPESTFIVNSRRQLLFTNAAARSRLGLGLSDLVGLRPGEILDCVHSREMPGGCGSSESCKVCGSLNVMLEALEGGTKAESECRITIKKAGKTDSLDVRVTAVPIASDRGKFLLVTFVDIGDKRRREVLERLFFHDLVNHLSSLQAGMFLVGQDLGPVAERNDFFIRTSATADMLVDEVVQQKELFAMEKGDLEVEHREIDLPKLARELVRHVEIADYAKDRTLVLREEKPACPVRSDPTLLRRVILNMVKNALEASKPGEEVVLALGEREDRVAISVSNSGFIPREAQLQIFQRSFSTKGKGRGIGTYSMQLLTEEYLKGRISFTSSEEEGTTFLLTLPTGP